MPRFLNCLAIFVFAVSALGQSSAPPSNGSESVVLRQKVQVVTLNASVVDHLNRSVTGLGRDNFEIYEDKIKQKIEYFSDIDSPVSVGVIFDASSSMQSKLSKAREAVQAFIAASHPADDFFLVTFNRYAQVSADFTDGDEVLRKIANLQTNGNTALYDAVYLGLEKIKAARYQKRVLLVISDGQDNCSRYRLRELNRQIKENNVIIYSFSLAEMQGSDCGQLCQSFARRAMEEIAEMTGGKAFFPLTPDDLEKATSAMALELRRQYSLGYIPTNSERDGRWRKINVRVVTPKELSPAPPKVIVRTREGYFAQP